MNVRTSSEHKSLKIVEHNIVNFEMVKCVFGVYNDVAMRQKERRPCRSFLARSFYSFQIKCLAKSIYSSTRYSALVCIKNSSRPLQRRIYSICALEITPLNRLHGIFMRKKNILNLNMIFLYRMHDMRYVDLKKTPRPSFSSFYGTHQNSATRFLYRNVTIYANKIFYMKYRIHVKIARVALLKASAASTDFGKKTNANMQNYL